MNANLKPSTLIDEREYEDPIDLSQPEKRLLRGILIRAIQDATGNIAIAGERAADVEQEAYAWILSNERQEDTHFSFLWLCEWLDLSPKLIRKFVENARSKRLKVSIYDNVVLHVPYDQQFHYRQSALL